MNKEGSPKSWAHHDLIDELSRLAVPESVSQAFTEKLSDAMKLAKGHSLGAETLTVAEPTPLAAVVSSKAASNTDHTSLQMFKPGK